MGGAGCAEGLQGVPQGTQFHEARAEIPGRLQEQGDLQPACPQPVWICRLPSGDTIAVAWGQAHKSRKTTCTPARSSREPLPSLPV